MDKSLNTETKTSMRSSTNARTTANKSNSKAGKTSSKKGGRKTGKISGKTSSKTTGTAGKTAGKTSSKTDKFSYKGLRQLDDNKSFLSNNIDTKRLSKKKTDNKSFKNLDSNIEEILNFSSSKSKYKDSVNIVDSNNDMDKAHQYYYNSETNNNSYMNSIMNPQLMEQQSTIMNPQLMEQQSAMVNPSMMQPQSIMNPSMASNEPISFL